MIPEQVVAQMRNSLSKLGLTFDEVPMMEGGSGSFELPLTSFGGRFGKDENSFMMNLKLSEGISITFAGGLSLVLNYAMQEDNSCRLTASIK